MRIWISQIFGELYFQLTFEELRLWPISYDLIKELKREIPRDRISYDYIERVWTIKGLDNHQLFYFVLKKWRKKNAELLEDPRQNQRREV